MSTTRRLRVSGHFVLLDSDADGSQRIGRVDRTKVGVIRLMEDLRRLMLGL